VTVNPPRVICTVILSEVGLRFAQPNAVERSLAAPQTGRGADITAVIVTVLGSFDCYALDDQTLGAAKAKDDNALAQPAGSQKMIAGEPARVI